jgi:thiamine phosphate synthase YjbQ (UPF0047 family)
MGSSPAEITLSLTPKARYDVIDVARRVEELHGDVLRSYPRALYCSYHTTAGYLEQGLCTRLQNNRQYLDPFIYAFQTLFPPGADYRHDRIELRSELSAAERRREPKNGDSHLAFIGSGLRNCATYVHRRTDPVYLIDLDGVGPQGCRERRTTVLAYNREETVASLERSFPVSQHSVDAVNLRDPGLGLLEEITDLVRRHGVERGRLDLSLGPLERHAGLTVNEYETLLMQHDLMEVLRDPLRFMAIKGRNMLRDPWHIPNRTLDYAKYDLIHVFNEAMEALKISESTFERLLVRCISIPATRFLRLGRGVSFMVSGDHGDGPVVRGTFQSPILLQWRATPARERRVRVSLARFS